MEFHPVSEILPMCSEDELNSLAESIRLKGLKHPIITYEGKILDGRNRYIACRMAGIEPRFEIFNDGDPREFVITENIERRQLTREQRNEIIRKLRGEGMTFQKIADTVGVSTDTAHRVSHNIELSGIGKLTGADGKAYPAHYAPRQIEEADVDPREYNRQQIIEANRQGASIEVPPQKSYRHVSDDSYEWYTPKKYVEKARSVMNGIDLDPASCIEANKIIRAKTIYTKKQNGLTQNWTGRIFLNPPYCMPEIEKFCDKVIKHYSAKQVSQAIILVNNATDTGWFHRLLNASGIACFTKGRIKYWGPNSAEARQGQVFFYLGRNHQKFIEEFKGFGVIVKVA